MQIHVLLCTLGFALQDIDFYPSQILRLKVCVILWLSQISRLKVCVILWLLFILSQVLVIG